MATKSLPAACAAALLLAALWYIQAPARSVDDFGARVADTAEGLRSQLESARLWAATVNRGDATAAAGTVGLTEADADAAELASDFAELQPPERTRRLRKELLRLAGDATAVLGDARIAAHRGSWEEVAALSRQMRRVSGRLDRLSARAKA